MSRQGSLHEEFDFILTEEDLADLHQVEEMIAWPCSYDDRKDQIICLRQTRQIEQIEHLFSTLCMPSDKEEAFMMSCES